MATVGHPLKASRKGGRTLNVHIGEAGRGEEGSAVEYSATTATTVVKSHWGCFLCA